MFNRDKTPPLRGEVRQHRRLQDGQLGNAKMAMHVVSGGPRTYASTTDPRLVYRSLYINRRGQYDVLPSPCHAIAFLIHELRRTRQLTQRTHPPPPARDPDPTSLSQVQAYTHLADQAAPLAIASLDGGRSFK